MTFEEYRELAQRTDATTNDRDKAANGAIGLYGEVNELLHAPDVDSTENVKETGDILWYLAAIATALHISLEDAYNSAAAMPLTDVMMISLEWRATVIGEFIKKAVFQGHTVDGEALEYVTHNIGLVMRWLEGYAMHNDFTLNAAMGLNIDKLKKRYPDGFEAERSMHRQEYGG